MSTPEDLRVDALAEMMADAAWAVHDAAHGEFPDPADCAFCHDAAIEAEYIAAGFPGLDPVLQRAWDGDR